MQTLCEYWVCSVNTEVKTVCRFLVFWMQNWFSEIFSCFPICVLLCVDMMPQWAEFVTHSQWKWLHQLPIAVLQKTCHIRSSALFTLTSVPMSLPSVVYFFRGYRELELRYISNHISVVNVSFFLIYIFGSTYIWLTGSAVATQLPNYALNGV